MLGSHSRQRKGCTFSEFVLTVHCIYDLLMYGFQNLTDALLGAHYIQQLTLLVFGVSKRLFSGIELVGKNNVFFKLI